MYRPATMDDAHFLLRLRNDPLTRQMSFHQEPVLWHSHIKWLETNIDTVMIYEWYGVAMGVIRINGNELSWTVDPLQRGMGVGKKMVYGAVRGPASNNRPLYALIKSENEASKKIASYAGFSRAARAKKNGEYMYEIWVIK